MAGPAPLQSEEFRRSFHCSPGMDVAERLARALAERARLPEELDPPAAAQLAKLRYVSDRDPGITRHRRGKDFSYRDPSGARLRDAEALARIKSLAVPPAWTEVWICPDPRGHLQATGRDARGRKQYRYHARWREVRDATKYEHMLTFGRALPRIRKRVEQDLALPGLPRDKVLAAVVKLMEHTFARVGNLEYERENGSFGLTTLRNRHVTVQGAKVELDFRAKHGLRHHSVVSDRKLARILKNCQDLPGAELFQYLDEDGGRHSIDSEDVNAYLREISGADITAKDFRTWAASNLALVALASRGQEPATKKIVVEVVKCVAAQLGNTPAVCRKCYIHPALFESYAAGTLQPVLVRLARQKELTDMSRVERTLLRFLVGRAAAQP